MNDEKIETLASKLFKERFFPAGAVISAWGRIIEEKRTDDKIAPLEEMPRSCQVRFSVELLEKLAEDPSNYFVYDSGLSLREIRAIFGSDSRYQPCQRRNNSWWLWGDNHWTAKRGNQGYYLVNLKGSFGGRSWDEQENDIQSQCKGFVRAPSRLIISVQVSHYLLRGYYISGDFFNWGPEVEIINSNIKVACISNVGANGFCLYNLCCGFPNGLPKDEKLRVGFGKIGVFLMGDLSF